MTPATAPPVATPDAGLWGDAAGDGGLGSTARRLANLLTGGTGELMQDGGSLLDFEPEIRLRTLPVVAAPADVWAVDGGQALVADARCLQVYVTRVARIRFSDGATVALEDGELRTTLLGGGESRRALSALGLDLARDTSVDVNLVRDRWEWDAVDRSVEEVSGGGLVLVDGDLQADWRLPPALVGAILDRAAERGVTVAGVTKHSSLSRGGAPLLGQLELEGEEVLGPSSRWWAPVARTRQDPPAPDVTVLAARLDPAAPFAFRVDLPTGSDYERVLGALAALADDAAFPGYPYPLSVADRLAACPRWLREEVRMELDDLLARNGVSLAARERAFSDRHRLMERG